MRIHLLETLIGSVKKGLGSKIGKPIDEIRCEPMTESYAPKLPAAQVSITGDMVGQLCLEMSRDLAEQFAAVFSSGEDLSDEVLGKAVSGCGVIVAGQLCAESSPLHLTVTDPEVSLSENDSKALTATGSIVQTEFQCGDQPMLITAHLRRA